MLLAGIVGMTILYCHFQKAYAGVNLLLGIIFVTGILLLSGGVTFLILTSIKAEVEVVTNFCILIFAVSICLYTTEILLRHKQVNSTYMELRLGVYISLFVKKNDNVLWTCKPEPKTYIAGSEYVFERHHNSYRFSDDEFVPIKNAGEIRIQTYGDSFTEGDGAPADSSYPSILRTIFDYKKLNNITVQNLGVCGNDPAFCSKQLKEIGATLNPDIAVITYGTGDLNTDFLTRGGLERFKENYWEGKSGPWYEWLCAYSYIFRLCAVSMFHVSPNNFFLTPKEKDLRIQELRPAWNKVFLEIAKTARKEKIKVLLIKKPEAKEVTDNKYENDFSFFEKIADTISVFKRYDLLPYYRDSAHVNVSNYLQYYWPKDGHHNPTGYAIMARGVFEGLQESYPEIFSTLDSAKANDD